MRAMEIKKYTGNRRRKRLRQMVILFLFLTVFLGGKRLWEEDLTEQAGYLTERSRETLPVLFQAAFRHYCPAGTSGEKEREENGETWWMEKLWGRIPLYRQGGEKRLSYQTAEAADPAYRMYLEKKQADQEYRDASIESRGTLLENVMQADGSQAEGQKTDGQAAGEETAAKVLAESSTQARGAVYPIEQLADYDFMMSHFFSVHPSTTAGRDIMDAAAFLGKDLRLAAGSDEPQILVYHTHSQETYADYSPENPEATVVGVGNYLAELLQEKGYNVIHDTSAYDIQGGQLDRSKAYTYALEGITRILQENPSIQVVLDLHRDGVDEENRLVAQVNGKTTARIMFFLGMSRTPEEAIEYLPNPNLEDNLAFSFQMQLKAEEYFPGFTRKIYLKGLRYNLHVRPRSSLIEVGAQNNTYEEARNAMEPLAEVLDMVLQGK